MAAIRKQGYKQITRSFIRKIDAQSWSIKIESEIERGVYLDQSIAQRSTLDGLLAAAQAIVEAAGGELVAVNALEQQGFIA